MLMPLVLLWGYKRLYKAPPQGSVVWETILVFREMIRRNGLRKMLKGGDAWWNSAKPSVIAEQDGTVDTQRIFWDDQFVDEIRQSLAACGVFFLIPIFLLADNGIGNQLNDMSAAMTLNSIPNDIMSNFNPLAIIVATPILTYGLYPLCERLGFPLRPMTRMSIGFLLATVEMIICAIVQNRIYKTSPCGSYATDCEEVSPVNLAWQIPIYIIPAVGELFVMVTSYELAYTRAPARMKGLVYAICLFSNAIPAAIGLALSKVITDPNLVIPYYVLAGATFVCAFLFPTVFRHLNEPIKVFAETDRMEGKEQPKAIQEKLYGDEEKQ
jgi:POT family proton-dependent oligopeptide transporter